MIFQELTPDEMQAIEKAGELYFCEQGSPLIREGAAGTSFALIISGKAEVRKSLSGGRHKKLADLGPADVIGEMGFLGIQTRSASVVALTDCQVLEFNRERFDRYLAGNPGLGLKIYRGIARELARRLAANDETLLDTLAWALQNKEEDSLTRDALIPPRRQKLTLKPRDEA